MLVNAQTENPDLPEKGNIVLPESIYVRSGTTREAEPIGELTAGQFVHPVNINAEKTWVFIEFNVSFGWVNRDIIRWTDDIDNLPVRDVLDPLPTIDPAILSATPVIFTPTRSVNYVLIDADKAYIRSGPGRTYDVIGQILSEESIEYPIGRTEDSVWVLFQYEDENGKQFGWILASLVEWFDDIESLPILTEDALTPTSTFTPSNTPTHTYTPTSTYTSTATSTNTNTATSTSTATNTDTPTVTDTATDTPTSTSTYTDVPTNTDTPTETLTLTSTSTATNTDIPTSTYTFTHTMTATSTASLIPSETDTVVLSVANTDVPTATNTDMPTETLTLTSTSTATNTDTPTSTSTSTSTATDAPTSTHTDTPTLTDTATEEATEDITAIAAVAESDQPTPTQLSEIDITEIPPTDDSGSGRFPIEAVIGSVLFIVVLLYIALYWNGLSLADRYVDGFVIDDCPVCHAGKLHVESRQERLFGIPTVKHTVRCDNCRSVLRETGNRRWRYAVDRVENPDLYDRYNGKEIKTGELASLLVQKQSSSGTQTLPEFVDDPDDSA